MVKETIYGTIPSKSNSYTVGRVNGHPCIVKSNEMKRYERSFVKQCSLYKGKNISTPFRLVVDVFYPDYTHDLDNSLKGLLDCLQYVGSISNDNLCVEISAKRHYDRVYPRVEYSIEEIHEQMRLFDNGKYGLPGRNRD